MKEVFEKIVEKLEELKKAEIERDDLCDEEGCGDGEEIYEDGKSQGRFEQVVRIIEIVKQEAEKYNNGWIPCSERLPEKKGKYLTTSKIYFVPDHVDEPDNYIGLEITYYSEINGWNGEVIAWQPLPAPYHQNGEQPKRTNFDRCCESMEAMAQIIDIAKIGWTKDQIMEWLQSEAEESDER